MVRILLLLILIVAIPFHIGCKAITEPTMVVEVPSFVHPIQPKVVLITIDGVRWQEIFNGTDPILYHGQKISARELLPNLYHYFVDNGIVVGKDSNFIATGPRHISLPGYLEIMRGHPSKDCQTNECDAPVLDDNMTWLFKEPAVFASWDTIKKTVPNKIVVNCGRSYRSEAWKKAELDDNQKFPEYWDEEYRPDFLTQQAALDYFQYYNPDFFWVSLGDTDEWAHAGRYQEYLDSLRAADAFVGQVIRMVNNSPEYTFIITADHGRNLFWQHHGEDAESARDWLMMAGRGIPKKGFVTYKSTKSLSNILPTVKHIVTGIPQKESLL